MGRFLRVDRKPREAAFNRQDLPGGSGVRDSVILGNGSPRKFKYRLNAGIDFVGISPKFLMIHFKRIGKVSTRPLERREIEAPFS
jgi:hypothetical protein